MNLPAGLLAEGLGDSQSGQQEVGPEFGAGCVDQQKFTQQSGTGQRPVPGRRDTEVHCQGNSLVTVCDMTCMCEQDILHGMTSWHAVAVCCRDEELHEARSKTSRLSEELSAVKQQTREDYESSMKTLHRGISEVTNGRNVSFG